MLNRNRSRKGPGAEPRASADAAPAVDVRRIDVGDGIYVRIPSPELAAATAGGGAVAAAAAPRARASDEGPSGVKWTVPVAAAPAAVALAGAALARHGLTEQGWLAAGLLGVLAVLGAIDIRWRLLPNRIVLPATAAVLAWQVVFATGRMPEWIGAALGAAAFLALPALFRRGAIGMGDVKLGLLLGAALGAEVVDALLIGFVATVPVTVALLARRRDSLRSATLPLGPFLGIGAAVVLLG